MMHPVERARFDNALREVEALAGAVSQGRTGAAGLAEQAVAQSLVMIAGAKELLERSES